MRIRDNAGKTESPKQMAGLKTAAAAAAVAEEMAVLLEISPTSSLATAFN